MKELYDSWFDELYEDLCWEQACKEQITITKRLIWRRVFYPNRKKSTSL